MAMYAVVNGGKVVNIVDWDGTSDWHPPEGSQAVPVPTGIDAGIGYLFDGTKYTAPAVPA